MNDSEKKLYAVWRSMKERCNNPNHPDYSAYGKRGIKVCEEWLHNYPAFEDWAYANDYREGRFLDREDNDLGYTIGNCRWVSQYISQRNVRPIPRMYIEAFGETKRMTDWCKQYEISYSTVRIRMKLGASIEEALTTQKDKRGKRYNKSA